VLGGARVCEGRNWVPRRWRMRNTELPHTAQTQFLKYSHNYAPKQAEIEVIPLAWLLAIAQYPEVMANRARWPQLGIQPQNLHEHATQLIIEAIALLALDRGQRQKLLNQLFESFVNSVKTYAKKTKEQPSSHDILDKLNQIHHLAKSFIVKDITLIKNAINNTM
jgi:hypothetical protein